MVDFSLTDEQKALRQLARDFAKNEIAPHAARLDETGEYPMDILKKAWEVGLMNLHIKPEYGGSGMNDFEEMLTAEELNYACSGVATAILANNLALAPVLLGADEYVMKKFIEPMTQEFTLCAYAVTEPGAGSDVAGIRTTAVRVSDEYIINGSKQWITNAGVSDWMFVLTKTDPSLGHKGMTGFIIDSKSPGVIIGKKEKNMGQRCSDTRSVTFEDVKVPKNQMIGKEGDGFKIAMGAFDHTRPAVAIGAVGVAKAALDHAVRYANTRNAFGKPISANQG
ncbi:MAG TPA: acyl-CoA dehydrogenase family protein, partial [Leptospiraceae bacterium]|nr:acyl-CoA dehydrogenase family protein [Leptospiraceae bacterium]